MCLFCEMLQMEARKLCASRILRRYGDEDVEAQNGISYILSPLLDADVNRLIAGDYWISIPQKMEVTKWNTTRKRIVFTFLEREKYFFKLMIFCLAKYDDRFCDSLYSFRANRNVRNAIGSIQRKIDRNVQWVFITDLHSFASNMDVPILLKKLRAFDLKDPALAAFLEWLLSRGQYFWENELVSGNTGALPGAPIAAFFMNVYLADLDSEMRERGVTFYRYADDMLLAATSKEECERLREVLMDFLVRSAVTLNQNKTRCLAPGEAWSFLGFAFLKNGEVDIAPRTINKIKRRLRCFANRLRKCIAAKNMTVQEGREAFMTGVNRALFWNNERRLGLAFRYFPLITRVDRLKEMDTFVQNYVRYLATGRFTKKNYIFRYDQLKKLGYKSLVSAYYRYKEGGAIYEYDGAQYFAEI